MLAVLNGQRRDDDAKTGAGHVDYKLLNAIRQLHNNDVIFCETILHQYAAKLSDLFFQINPTQASRCTISKGLAVWRIDYGNAVIKPCRVGPEVVIQSESAPPPRFGKSGNLFLWHKYQLCLQRSSLSRLVFLCRLNWLALLDSF